MQKVSKSGLCSSLKKITNFTALGFFREQKSLFLVGVSCPPSRAAQGCEGGWGYRGAQGQRGWGAGPFTSCSSGSCWCSPSDPTRQSLGNADARVWVTGVGMHQGCRHLGLAPVSAACLSLPGSRCTKIVSLLMAPISPVCRPAIPLAAEGAHWVSSRSRIWPLRLMLHSLSLSPGFWG